MDPVQFMETLMANLSPIVHTSRFVDARFEKGYVGGSSVVFVTFYNLPEKRVKEKRGGGAEAMNNRQLFSVRGFSDDQTKQVSKVQLEQITNGIYSERGSQNFDVGLERSKNLRKKTGSPDKVALYLATYINEIAETHKPNFTHE